MIGIDLIVRYLIEIRQSDHSQYYRDVRRSRSLSSLSRAAEIRASLPGRENDRRQPPERRLGAADYTEMT